MGLVIAVDPLRLIMEERFRQDQKWGADRNLPNYVWLAILVEEVGESAKAGLEGAENKELLGEVTQVAAVAVAWMEAIQRNMKENKE